MAHSALSRVIRAGAGEGDQQQGISNRGSETGNQEQGLWNRRSGTGQQEQGVRKKVQEIRTSGSGTRHSKCPKLSLVEKILRQKERKYFQNLNRKKLL